MATEKVNAPTPPVGVIESLSRGFEIVAGNAALLLLPLLLDLFLWVGPRVSLKHYYQDIWLPTANNPQLGSTWQGFLVEPEEIVNLIPDAQYLPVLIMPSVLAGAAAEGLPFNYVPPVWELGRLLSILLVNMLGYVAGVLLLTPYLSMIATSVGGHRPETRDVLIRLPLNTIQLGLLGIVVPIFLLILIAPFLLIGAVLALLHYSLALVMLIIGLTVAMWFCTFGAFTIHGMFMHRRNALSALWDSVRVVQWNMSSTLFLLLLVIVINQGGRIIWALAGTDSWLILLAITANAFATTGLIASTFVFYKDRYRYWREMREALLAELQRRRTQNRTPL